MKREKRERVREGTKAKKEEQWWLGGRDMATENRKKTTCL
jgi:hypothetical protein